MTNNRVTFTAEPRTLLGKKTKTLRKQGFIPANVSGDLDQPLSVVISTLAFERLYAEVGDTGLIYLNVAGTDHPVLIDDVQIDSLDEKPLHVVFKQVNLREKIEAEVPVELVGESTIPNTVVVLVHDEITVEALPADLPDKFEIDVTTLTEVGQQVTFAQLSYDKSKVTLMIEADQVDEPVVILQEHVEQVEETPAEGEEAPTEAAIIGEDKAEEAPATE